MVSSPPTEGREPPARHQAATIRSAAAKASFFACNCWKAYGNPQVAHAGEEKVAKLVSLVVKLGALADILFIPTKFSPGITKASLR